MVFNISSHSGLTWKKVGELINIVLICRYCFPKSLSLWYRKLSLHLWVSFMAYTIMDGGSKTFVGSNYLHMSFSDSLDLLLLAFLFPAFYMCNHQIKPVKFKVLRHGSSQACSEDMTTFCSWAHNKIQFDSQRILNIYHHSCIQATLYIKSP